MNTAVQKKPTSDELLEQIFKCMDILFREKELSAILKQLNDLGKILVFADRCSFWYWDKRAHKLWTLDAHGVDKITIDEGSGLVGYAISHNENLVINDPYNDSRFNSSVDKKTGYKTESILVTPVTNIDGEVIGAYQAINRLYDEKFSDDDIKRLSLAAAFLGKTLESHLLYNAALEDQLTGLRNRRGFFENYNKNIVPLLESGGIATVIICDIDHFKRVNDTYGHNAGDAVLRMVADTFRDNARVDDGVFRWGGEEFIFMLPRTTLEGGVEFAERMRKAVEANRCQFEDLTIKVTMSFGVSQINNDITIDENIKDADGKLYIAKESGRNQVRF
ncbi:MAG: diguanylate cyclase [Huintestinicola sp.]